MPPSTEGLHATMKQVFPNFQQNLVELYECFQRNPG